MFWCCCLQWSSGSSLPGSTWQFRCWIASSYDSYEGKRWPWSIGASREHKQKKTPMIRIEDLQHTTNHRKDWLFYSLRFLFRCFPRWERRFQIGLIQRKGLEMSCARVLQEKVPPSGGFELEGQDEGEMEVMLDEDTLNMETKLKDLQEWYWKITTENAERGCRSRNWWKRTKLDLTCQRGLMKKTRKEPLHQRC